MASNRTPNRSRKPPEPWRIERMVQRVPAHIGEETNFSPWLVVGAVAVVVLVGGLLLFFSGIPENIGIPVPTSLLKSRTPRPTIVIEITATPEPFTATPTRRRTPYMVSYTVKSGDTLGWIANHFNVTVDQIQSANALNGDIIHAGDKLLIPQPTPTLKPGAIALVPTDPPTDTPTPTATRTGSAFNTPTLIPTAANQSAALTTPTPTRGVVVYYVQNGDTLGTLAHAFSTTVESIMNVNHMSNTNIRAGQAITIPVGAWTPTTTPTRLLERTITPTPELLYNAPALLLPGRTRRLMAAPFQWTGVGVLPNSISYIISLRYSDGTGPITRPYDAGQATSYRLDASPSGQPNTPYTWYIIVVQHNGCGSSAAASQPCAVSPPSEMRTFTWK